MTCEATQLRLIDWDNWTLESAQIICPIGLNPDRLLGALWATQEAMPLNRCQQRVKAVKAKLPEIRDALRNFPDRYEPVTIELSPNDHATLAMWSTDPRDVSAILIAAYELLGMRGEIRE